MLEKRLSLLQSSPLTMACSSSTTSIHHLQLFSPSFSSTRPIKHPNIPYFLPKVSLNRSSSTPKTLVVRCNSSESGEIPREPRLRDLSSGMVDERVEELLKSEENKVLLDDLENAMQKVNDARNELADIEKQEHDSGRLNDYVRNLETRKSESTNEDTDEMFDDLFKKYGKVVYKRNDKKPASAEVDDDAESLSFAVALAKVASEVKAGDIQVLFVKPLVYWTRFFIIATAFSRPQIDAIGSKIRHTAETQFGKVATGDTKPNSWTLLDFGDVVVHIFLPQQRAFYNLEEFYGNATPIELPFDTQSSFRN